MRPFKEYDKKELEQIVKKCRSMREVGRILGISHPNAKEVVLRYNIKYPHFVHGKTHDKMINKKYHMLTVLSIYRKKYRHKNRNRNRVYANCLCDCGNKKKIRADELKDDVRSLMLV
jgi:hypothetical protein